MLNSKLREETQVLIYRRNATVSNKEMFHVWFLLHLDYQLTCIHVSGAFIKLRNEALDNPSI